MAQGWLAHLGPTDLIAATVDITMGIVAAAWVVVVTVRSIHRRSQHGPSE